MSLTDFRAIHGDHLFGSKSNYLPTIVTYDGDPVAILARLDEVIVISDLHPRVRAQLKALEAKARVGMPAPERVWIDSPTPVATLEET